MEAEAREILAGALAGGSNDVGLGSRIRQRFDAIGGVELEVADRAEHACTTSQDVRTVRDDNFSRSK